MSSVLENAYLRHRLRQMDQLYPEPSTFGHCDCTSYSYFALSLVLFVMGAVITVLALGDADGYLFSNLGHMWLVGPIFICSGLMIAVKSILYLRRKSVIQMLLRQRALLRGLQELAQQSRSQQSGCVIRNPSTVTLPPTYEALMGTTESHGGSTSTEAPPPTYEEAMFLMGDEKLCVVLDDPKYPTTSSSHQRKGSQSTSRSQKPGDAAGAD
ncbi:uncharacterized protein LOC124595608 isoform X1 [Schistocerca americana]|uniref:uncharacterized protein LOC126334973 n=1 Tax=Schistocerca gregaria TaxID=7010 RepID=UPI001F4F7977|nr:uncharacterized protein LOC124595608 isoform X1 [Schistocerca americana]XP_047107883.1 uncharacterized protein LOC124776789 isoform X1 [Schistocerca piceifrons]XP_049775369.1 uncharacterized protein LOC126162741 isoform X1 [Schistocerca cancellata]XP_049801116.1 uncharacterized protein LOC126236091 isoform X1 [Schistocerca nitens]XP_049853719.1 uncharacterized protein LOC126334973 [Schistocerca gregaria]XP_049950954.1 uncharacterized protein LOC126458145 isoform X1 [Schistocerca serialis cu